MTAPFIRFTGYTSPKPAEGETRVTSLVATNMGDPRRHKRFADMTPEELIASVHPAGNDARAKAMALALQRLLPTDDTVDIPAFLRKQAL